MLELVELAGGLLIRVIARVFFGFTLTRRGYDVFITRSGSLLGLFAAFCTFVRLVASFLVDWLVYRVFADRLFDYGIYISIFINSTTATSESSASTSSEVFANAAGTPKLMPSARAAAPPSAVTFLTVVSSGLEIGSLFERK